MKQLGNHMTACNPRWRRAGNLKANIGDRQTLFCLTLIPHRWAFNRNLKYDSISYNLSPFRLRVEISFNSAKELKFKIY